MSIARKPDEETVTYRPSPRPTFDVPTAIPYSTVTRHIWGDAQAGEVADWIYASTGQIHALVFGLAPGSSFRHSPEFRTVFGADEVLHVLSGTMILANPETGEVQRVPAGGNVFFRADTWHHAVAHGTEPLRVLELFAPPPSAGTSGAYARERPYLEEPRYVDDRVLGDLPGGSLPGESFRERQTLFGIREDDVVYRLEGDALVGLLASTEHLTVATVSLGPGGASDVHRHGGDEVLYVREGALHVRAWHGDETFVFEVGPDDAVYVPEGARHEYRNYGDSTVEAIVGVASSYLA
jgi:quercetin dioxygenase-like cupin family protein